MVEHNAPKLEKFCISIKAEEVRFYGSRQSSPLPLRFLWESESLLLYLEDLTRSDIEKLIQNSVDELLNIIPDNEKSDTPAVQIFSAPYKFQVVYGTRKEYPATRIFAPRGPGGESQMIGVFGETSVSEGVVTVDVVLAGYDKKTADAKRMTEVVKGFLNAHPVANTLDMSLADQCYYLFDSIQGIAGLYTVNSTLKEREMCNTKAEYKDRKPAGRPKRTRAQQQNDEKLVTDWNAAKKSGEKKKDFAHNKGMTLKQLDQVLARERARLNRAK